MKGFCALLMLISVSLTAQVDYTQIYYPQVNRAEILIVEGDYEPALQSFQTAFEAVQFASSIDLYNAAVCALHLGEVSTARYLLIRVLGRGIAPDFVWDRLELFHDLLQPEWNAITAYPRVENGAYAEYRQELYEMEDLDQEFRTKAGGYRVYGDTIAAIDQRNINHFRKLIAKYGFPGEELFGAENQILTSRFPGLIVLRHYCQGISRGNYYGDDFSEILITAVKNGRLEPNLMALLIGLQNNQEYQLAGGGINVFKAGGKDSGYVVEKFNKEQIPVINRNRLSLGLDPIEDYHKKLAFSIEKASERGFFFAKFGGINQFPMDEATYDRIIENFEPLR